MKFIEGGVNTKETYTYNQYSKKVVRHSAIFQAVELLTAKREKACCVDRNYVRKIYDYYTLSEDYSRDKTEAEKVDLSYIVNWENLHDSYVSNKKPEDLSVCYLSGPEPDNDFQEFISFGILPQNIWAFESNSKAYQKAVLAYEVGEFPQPRILKQNIETFFQQTPKKFDIIYIDACGSVPSSQHALRCISTICQHHRLNSPGIIISNFAEPDIKNESIEGFYELVSQYLLFKNNPDITIELNEEGICNTEYLDFYNIVEGKFEYFYGEFISTILRDIPSIIIPIQRIAQNPYLNQLFDLSDIQKSDEEEIIMFSRGHSIANYFFSMKKLLDEKVLGEKSKCFLNEMGNYEDILLGLKIIILLKQDKLKLKNDINVIKNYFDQGDKLYRFLDKPHSNLLFDMIINQLAYPLHYNVPENIRYQYVAKTNMMFTDVTTYDECRYIYEWLPAMHQIISAFENISWQYVFRFAVDGLVKMRQNYNNEFFFQGSVISNSIKEFNKKELNDRIRIE